MGELSFKHRYTRSLPGRLRFELFGLLNDMDVSQKFEKVFSTIEGVSIVHANVHTGKVLLVFDEEKVSENILYLYVKRFEEAVFKKKYSTVDCEQMEEEAHQSEVTYLEVAATTDSSLGGLLNKFSSSNSYMETIPQMRINSSKIEKPPLPLTLAITGLGAIGIKQLIFGRSALARHPVPFYICSALSIASGYPFLKRGIHSLSKDKKINTDLLLGVSSFALAIARENLVVLAGLSILNYLNWRRKKLDNNPLIDQKVIPPKIEKYSRRMGRFGFAAAGINFALTRNPISSLAILLASNPRPILTSTEYTWNQADLLAKENKSYVPKNGSIYQLSNVNTIVYEDASLLFNQSGIRLENHNFLNGLRKGSKVAFLHNKHHINGIKLSKILDEKYGLTLVEDLTSISTKREEVLFVTTDNGTHEGRIVSYYPTVTLSNLTKLEKTYQKAKEIDRIVHRNLRLSTIWNLLGTVIAAPLIVSAPFVSLISDALGLSFITNAKRVSEKLFTDKKVNSPLTSVNHINQTPWHSIKSKDISERLKSNINLGLKSEQVNDLFRIYGENRLNPKAKPHWIKSYLGQFKEFATVILAGTALVSIFTGHLFDGFAMSTILLLNAAIGTMQERKAEQAVETLTKFVPPNCKVLRDGAMKEIPAGELVPGDIVELEAGELVPADLRIVQSWNLQANESSLTGESLPVQKQDDIVSEKMPLTDRSNMLYMGTHITRGKVKGIVVHTGNATEMGHIMDLLSEEEDKETPLQKQVTSISKKFMKGALVAGGIVFVAGLLRGVPLTQMITTSLALTASAIPEGLPVTITIALTAGIYRMAKKNSLIRKLSALETLGRATVICTDKTGTLTKNEMTVMKVATVVEQYKVSGEGYNPEGSIVDLHSEEADSKDLEKLLKIGLLCSNTSIEYQNNQWGIKGDPTEGAIVTLAAKRDIKKENHSNWKRLHEIPFDSATGKMTVVCKDEENEKQCFVMAKGSVEKILNSCTHYQKKGRRYPLTQAIRGLILNQNEEYAKQSLRVIAFAYRPIKADHCMDDVEDQLIYVGMVGMIDPPKADIQKSIQEALELGIRPVMITGDHPITALAIAKKVGICDGNKKVITGQELDNMSDEELDQIIDDVAVFARVTPEHKLRIVTLLQNKGHIVAMTGDGVNDSPAIKKAQIGIAMGQTGTQVTKEIADIVLKEDHFGSIVEGVKEGRTIISNIRKALGCLLSGNLAEIIVTSTAVIAGLPLPVIPIQILLMNLLTDALPAMVLAVNPGNKSKQTERQEIADKPLYKQVVTRGLILGLGAVGLFAMSLASGASLPVAQTTAFATLVAGQLIQTFSWRQQGTAQNVKDWSKDKFLVGALGASWLTLIATIYIPGLGGIFKTAALPFYSWLPIVGVAGCSAILAKYLVRLQTVKPSLLNVRNQGQVAVA